MKYLIIGSEGALGKALAGRLHKRKSAAVIGIDINKRSSSACSKYYSADIKNTDRIIEIFIKEKPDVIFNLAAVFNSTSREELFEINCSSPLRMLERLSEKKVKVILIGSAAEYGMIKQKGLIDESAALNPVSDYGVSKACQTYFSLRIAKKNRHPGIIVARLFNLIGPGISTSLFVGAIAKQIAQIENKKQKPVIKVGNLKAYRDYLPVGSAAEYLSVLAIKGKSGEVYNICSGKARKIESVLKDMISECALKVKISKAALKKRSDPGYAVGDNRKISKLLKLKPGANDWKMSVKDTVDWYRRSV